MNNLFKFYNEEQIADLMYAITRHFKIRVSETINLDEWNINTKLYPTDRFIEVTARGYENALWEFTQELKKYMSDELKAEIELILNTEKYLEAKANKKRVDIFLKILESNQ